MVYEKYIRKNGKLYGPYTYHSKRVNGKVVSEYHGAQKKPVKFNFAWVVLGGFLLLLLISGFFFSNPRFAGRVSLDILPNVQGEALGGILSLSLKEGELIPASSKVILDFNGTSYEYVLSDIVDENFSSGNFYVEGKDVSGSGQGYGFVGVKRVYPDVSFTLDILSESSSVTDTSGGSSSPEEAENVVPVEEEPQVTEDTTGPTQEVSEEVVSVSEESSQVAEESVSTSEETTQESEPAAEITSVSEESSQLSESSDSSGESTEGESAPAEPSLTGSVIAGFFRSIANSFLVLTGQVSLELEKEVNGVVSFGESFTYSLGEGESAELKSGSVSVDGESVDDNVVSLDVIDNEVIVTTEYSKEEEGFGEDYLGDSSKTISINLSKLNLAVESEDVKVSFVYGGEELVSVSTSQEVEVPVEEIPEEIVNESESVLGVENASEEISNESVVLNVSLEEVSVEDTLTEEEKFLLIDNVGDLAVDITRAESVNGRVEVVFEFGLYSIEHSYDGDLSEEELAEWIERDKIRFLRDILEQISKESASKTEIEGVVGSYGL